MTVAGSTAFLLRNGLLGLALMALGLPAGAEDAIPNLVGEWSGVASAVVIGSGGYRPGDKTLANPAFVDDRVFTYKIQGQNGRLFWGLIESGDRTEPFAAVISSDNKTAYGADTDGRFNYRIVSADEIELCYTQPASGPLNQIVATCFPIKRKK